MAIKGFKEIENQKGYKLDSKDREIFERELKESLFGTSATTWNVYGNSDMIEFVLFDSNDNQLPQGEEGKMVRYVFLDDANIAKYFRISENVEDIKLNGAKEFLVDTEVLIREAGYSNGIFKTQITLLNRRAGSETIEYDKMWIHEISPSRTEIRILPVSTTENIVKPDLQERYNVYINDGDFRDDTISFVQEYVEAMDLNKIFAQMLAIKGKITEGSKYIDLIKQEFKIDDFGKFFLDIKTKFIQSMQYWVENRNSNINSLQYGQILTVVPPIDLGVYEIQTKSLYTLTETIDYLLNKRDILEKSTLSIEEQITFDEIQDILKTTTEDSIYDTTIPESISAAVRGCMDPNAENFNPDATVEDGSCIYPIPPIEEVETPVEEPVSVDTVIRTKTYYWWENDAWLSYKGVDGTWHKVEDVEFEFNEISFIEGPNIHGDIRTYPKPVIIQQRCTDPTAINYGQVGVCEYNPVYINPHGIENGDGFIVYPDDPPPRYDYEISRFGGTFSITNDTLDDNTRERLLRNR